MYPALSVLQALRNEAEVLWVGGEGGMEADLVARQNVPFKAIPAAGLHGVGLAALPRNLLQMARGVLAARRVLAEFRPDVIFFTGGFIAGPVAVAARSIPSLLYVPDIEPGNALSFLARSAKIIALTTDTSRVFFQNARQARLVVTGYPTRSDLQSWSRSAAKEKLGLSDERPVVLIFGGSKGARSINRALLYSLPRLLQRAEVLHISGKLDWEDVLKAREQLPAELAGRYHAFDYLHEMGAAFAAADLVVSRAGASCLGEYPLFGLPAVLAPYPYAWRYQKVNAGYLVERNAALLLEDERLATDLIPLVENLLDHPQQLDAMRQSMRALAQPDAAQKIAALICELAGSQERKG